MKLLTGSGNATETPQPRQGPRQKPPGKYDRVSGDAFLRMMGMKLDGHKPS
jgi:hypothetical protein